MKFYLYILKSTVKDKFYIGISKNPYLRLDYHNTIEKGFTSRYRPWVIAFLEEFDSKTNALKAERKIKSWKSKTMIKRLIDKEIDIKDYI